MGNSYPLSDFMGYASGSSECAPDILCMVGHSIHGGILRLCYSSPISALTQGQYFLQDYPKVHLLSMLIYCCQLTGAYCVHHSQIALRRFPS